MLGTTVFILFIMLVAAANICLGFAAAIALGVGPQAWPLIASATAPPAHEENAPDHGPADALQAEHPPEPASPSAAAEVPAETTLDAEAASSADLPAPEATPQIRLTVEETAEPVAPVEATLESVLIQFARGFDLFEAELANWDQRRREEEADVDQLTNSAIELNGLAAGYLDHFQASVAALDAMVAEAPGIDLPRATLRQAGDELAVQLRTSIAELGSLQFEPGNVQEASERLDQALPRLLQSLHAICSQLEEPVALLVQAQAELGTLAPTLIEHSQISLIGRLCFEHLCDISVPHGCVAMFDIDRLSELHEQQGAMVVRRLLQSLAETAQGLVPIGTPISRLAGKQFALCLADTSPDDAVEVLENIRQQIAQTRFAHGEERLTVSVSCAVVATQSGDGVTEILERLRTSIRAAKAAGRNCTYQCELDQPVAVPAANLTVSSLTVAL